MKEIDDGFIGRVYRTSAFMWAFGLLACVVLMRFWAAAGWTVGAAVSVGILKSIEHIVRRSFVPGHEEARGDLTKFSLLKLPIIIAVLAIVVLAGGRSFEFIIGFCAGLLLTQAVIVLKTLGRMISGRVNNG